MEALDTMKRRGETPSADFYLSLLQLASRESDGEACEALLSAMDARGIARMELTYNCLIEARKGDPARCEELFVEMRARGLVPTRATYNTMLWIFCAQRRIEDAFALFGEMKEVADTNSFNTFMRAYAGDGDVQSVMRLSTQMKTQGIAHDVATYTTMVELLGRFGVKGALVVDAVVKEMEANNILPDVLLYDTLLDIYGGTGRWDKCETLWKEMSGRGISLGAGSCARFLEKHCRKDPNLYVKWKKEFNNFLPP
jgi:pentatricopeptide repeat protein